MIYDIIKSKYKYLHTQTPDVNSRQFIEVRIQPVGIELLVVSDQQFNREYYRAKAQSIIQEWQNLMLNQWMKMIYKNSRVA